MIPMTLPYALVTSRVTPGTIPSDLGIPHLARTASVPRGHGRLHNLPTDLLREHL